MFQVIIYTVLRIYNSFQKQDIAYEILGHGTKLKFLGIFLARV